MKKVLLGLILISTMIQTMNGQVFLNEGNIDEVLSSLTLEQKAQLLVGGGNDGFAGSGAMLGHQTRLVAGAAGITVEIPEQHIPSIVMADGPAGVHIDSVREGTNKTYYATGFPIGTALASTWNTELVEQVGQAIGNETREYGCDVILGPGMNIHRNPLCGRNFEYYSEDPLLTGKIGAAMVRGIQSQGVGACPKHYAVNSQESDRTKVDERLSAKALREIYLRGFEIMVREAKPWTIMSSYNQINGEFVQQSYDALTTILRKEWGFDGVVVTDWTGVRDTKAQVHAGNDLMMPGYPQQVQDIVEAVENGTLALADVDTCVRRMLQLIVRTPRYQHYAYSDQPDLAAHAAVTRQSATEGMVLLKNLGDTLPLRPEVRTIALFGVNSYDFASGGLGSGCVNTPYVVDVVAGLRNAGIATTPRITDIYQSYIPFATKKLRADKDPLMWFLDQGQPKLPEMEVSERLIESEVAQADAAIITLGRQAGEGMDRTIEDDFNLTADEHQLIRRVSEIFRREHKPVIVIINSGSVIETASWQAYADAILVAWQPGEEGGNSVADVLTGKVSPSGKLTMTWPITCSDHPSTRNFPQPMSLYDYKERANWGSPIEFVHYTNHAEGIYVGYRHFDTFDRPVAYPFGFGLSYTTFEYSRAVAKLQGEEVILSVTVRNTGTRSGKEIVQVYMSSPNGDVAHELKAFAKTRELQPGESETLSMRVPVRLLASFDEPNSQWLLSAGEYNFAFAASSRDIRATQKVRLKQYTEPVSAVLLPK
ncbi:MAG: glycoside hydrolase family 3 protein [Paludibacteraceae bacterium]|nr:glycoside hydrolase family 3 protein [Paludibacteraceae bacterium]